jgi:hypothetical protein
LLAKAAGGGIIAQVTGLFLPDETYHGILQIPEGKPMVEQRSATRSPERLAAQASAFAAEAAAALSLMRECLRWTRAMRL